MSKLTEKERIEMNEHTVRLEARDPNWHGDEWQTVPVSLSALDKISDRLDEWAQKVWHKQAEYGRLLEFEYRVDGGAICKAEMHVEYDPRFTTVLT